MRPSAPSSEVIWEHVENLERALGAPWSDPEADSTPSHRLFVEDASPDERTVIVSTKPWLIEKLVPEGVPAAILSIDFFAPPSTYKNLVSEMLSEYSRIVFVGDIDPVDLSHALLLGGIRRRA
jgi:hypothetical protein